MTKDEKLKILCENLSDFRQRQSNAAEERDLTLCHIVSTLCNENEQTIEEIANIYKQIIPDLDGDEEILLYAHLFEAHKMQFQFKSSFPIGIQEATPAGSYGRIACVRNNYNNIALEYFSQKINNSKPVFVSSFSAGCEAVSVGECEFCIIPIENMTEGKMPGFYSMIDRYELKICLVYDIEDDSGDTVRYALLSKSCAEPSERARSSQFIFEFSILSEDGEFIGRLLSAAKACRAVLLNFDCSPVQYDSGLRRYLIGFRISGHDVLPLRCFLALNYSYYTPIGFYPDTPN